ncbi:MAG: hypothetical protein KKD17_02220 [Nanoarchaeota archaeon]|nr:hypothetical protein [Nanoarchaeota archaeon]
MITKAQIMVFKRSADTLYSSADYTSATILYFKTLFAVQDFLLLEETGESPKDHNARFRSLEKNFPKLFKELDIEFTTYRDTYSKIIDKETCDRIKRIVENDIKQYNVAQEPEGDIGKGPEDN